MKGFIVCAFACVCAGFSVSSLSLFVFVILFPCRVLVVPPSSSTIGEHCVCTMIPRVLRRHYGGTSGVARVMLGNLPLNQCVAILKY